MFESFQIDKYFSEGKIIGSGSFANVCKGYHMETKEDVAIKIIKSAFANKSKKHKKQLDREIAIISNIAHINIVKCHGVYEHPTNSALCIIMEFCDGGTLDSYIKNKGSTLDEYKVQNIIKQLADGLTYLKQFNIIHRDLKPDNLLIKYKKIHNRKKFILKISDFGLATILSSEDELAQTRCGSRLYMAPEIYMGQDYTYKADLWSVGAILHLLIYGKPLFSRLPHPDMFRPSAALFNIEKYDKYFDISEACRNLLINLLKNNPQERISWDRFINHDFFKATVCKQLNVYKKSSIDITSESKIIENLLGSFINDSFTDVVNPIIKDDTIACNLINSQNKILSILQLGDKKCKKEFYDDAYILYKNGVLSIKKLLMQAGDNKKTELVKHCLKDIYNVFNDYIKKLNQIKNKCKNKNKPLLYIIMSYVRYLDKKSDINLMFNKPEKAHTKLRFGLSCLNYLQSFIVKEPLTKSCIDNYKPSNKKFVDTELLEILQNDKLTTVLIHHYVVLFMNKLNKKN